MPGLRHFGVIYSSNIYVNVIFMLGYCLFPRDLAFYLAFAYSFTILFVTVLEVSYQRPQFIMRLPTNHDDYVSRQVINSFQCMKTQFKPFAFPSYEMMLQIVFTLNIYLLAFHTRRNRLINAMQINLRRSTYDKNNERNSNKLMSQASIIEHQVKKKMQGNINPRTSAIQNLSMEENTDGQCDLDDSSSNQQLEKIMGSIDTTLDSYENDLAFLGNLTIMKSEMSKRRCNCFGHFMAIVIIVLLSLI